MRALIAGLLLLIAGPLAAQTCTQSQASCAWNEDCLTWNRPTTYTDGSALDATSIASYRVESTAAGATAWASIGAVNAPTQGFRRPNLKPGDAFQYRVVAVLKSGVESAPSNVCTLTTIEPPPSPPVLAVDALAYEIYPKSGVLTARAIGAVPLGTQCLPETQVVGTITYHRVATDMVDKDVRLLQPGWRQNRDLKLFARCG